MVDPYLGWGLDEWGTGPWSHLIDPTHVTVKDALYQPLIVKEVSR